jgi:hypothetical protein
MQVLIFASDTRLWADSTNVFCMYVNESAKTPKNLFLICFFLCALPVVLISFLKSRKKILKIYVLVFMGASFVAFCLINYICLKIIIVAVDR